MSKRILVTGAAGFIGNHLALRLLDRGDQVVSVDNLNPYYDVNLKKQRLARIAHYPNFKSHEFDLCDKEKLVQVFEQFKPDVVVNLAAQAGVRYSLTHPDVYVQSNLEGFLNILECCRHGKVGHLVYASSSSVYGANKKLPFSVHDNVDHPLSLYAASKKANELMAHTYSHLYKIPTTGLRFFTVYGPWGRPDMSLFLFTKAILDGKPIEVFNHGKHKRDFTYVDDIVEGVIRVCDRPAKSNAEWNGMKPDPATSSAPYKIYNIGNSNPEDLLHVIETLEKKLGKTAEKIFLPMQMGDVPETFADVSSLEADTGFKPKTSITDGINRFVDWYRSFYKV